MYYLTSCPLAVLEANEVNTFMKQYYAYNASGSTVAFRAGSIKDLLKKMAKGCPCKTNEDWKSRIEGLNKNMVILEPFYFYVKNDTHDDDDCALSIRAKKVMKEAIKHGFIKQT